MSGLLWVSVRLVDTPLKVAPQWPPSRARPKHLETVIRMWGKKANRTWARVVAVYVSYVGMFHSSVGKKEVIEERKPATRVKMCRDANFTWSHCSCCKWFFKIIIHIKSLFIPTITSNLYISSPCSFIKKHFPLSLPFLSNHNVELHEKGGPVRSWACRKQDPHVGCYDKQSGNYSSRGDVERREGIATVSATRTGS